MQLEDVSNILRKDNYYGVMVQFGGQNAVNLAVPIEKEIRRLGLSTRILGTSPDAMDIAEDRTGSACSSRTRDPQPANSSAYSEGEARAKAEKIEYRSLSGPPTSFGAPEMEIVHDERELETYMKEAVRVSREPTRCSSTPISRMQSSWTSMQSAMARKS